MLPRPTRILYHDGKTGQVQWPESTIRRSDGVELDGISYTDSRISIVSLRNCPTETFLHELNHQLLVPVARLTPDDRFSGIEETIVKTLTKAQVKVFSRNPDLLLWLHQELVRKRRNP